MYGLYIDGSCSIKSRNDICANADTLAEKLEHHYTTVGNILDQNNVSNRKQERIARFRAYNRRIGLSGIVQGYRNHCQSLHELAEYLDVTEEFLKDALEML